LSPGSGPPAEGWATFVARVCPSLGKARRNGTAWAELTARHNKICERLKVNRSSTAWQRMHDEARLQASLASFRRYALATFPDAYGKRPGITLRRDLQLAPAVLQEIYERHGVQLALAGNEVSQPFKNYCTTDRSRRR